MVRNLAIALGAVFALGVAITVVIKAREEQVEDASKRAMADEAYAGVLLRQNRLDAAKAQLRNAADNWHTARRPNDEQRARKLEADLANEWWKKDPTITALEFLDQSPTPKKDIFDEIAPNSPTPRPKRSP